MNVYDMTWIILRARLGQEHAISTDAIAAICRCTIGEVKRGIKALRDRGVRVAYSARTPQGYYIPTPDDEIDQNDTLMASLAAVASLIVRQMLTRRVSVGVIMYEIEGTVNARLAGPLAPLKKALPPPATQKQIAHLAHLILSSVLSRDERDEAYRHIASVDASKDSMRDLISDLRERIEKREQDREDSKRDRIIRQSIHHPDQPVETLVRRDLSRVRQVWGRAREGDGDDNG